MELSDFITTNVYSLFVYILAANWKQYTLVRDWSDSHQKSDIFFYEDWIQGTRRINKLNNTNFCVGTLGRRIAYKVHNKNKLK